MSRDRGTPSTPPPVVVDARGQRCPLPVLALSRALALLAAQDADRSGPPAPVRLLATDPAARTDVAAFARMRGLDLLAVDDEGDHTAYLVGWVSPRPAEPEPPARD